ncbi:MAG: energy transducer TonB [Bacteroidetes bacterium]|nr:MAG: energy transducer TonB [Bacteroidota bacterium]REK00756.1 MAG: energy transducer TonB [Bacteroidota bacterium]REK35004.1 MAG: energy transducer TonB [Bacteroidota bacterium]REK48198.1 MAG: energy transducer TonB [Bacteroidota bacterium]
MSKIFSWNEPVNPDRVELVFESRNKAYGGYILRKKYTDRLMFALIASIIGLLLLIAIPKLVSVLSKVEFAKKESVTEAITLAEPPPIDKSAPPPPPVIPPPPVQQTIKFTPPKVVKDEEAQEPPPTQEEVKEVQVSTVTQEGSKDIIDLPPENPVVGEDEGKIFTVVEEMPTFPGGEDKLFEYLSKNIKYPPVARENGIQGRVYVTFVVDKDGKVKDAKVLRGIGGGCDEEAIRVVKAMPQWKPGKQNGRNVQVQYNLPVSFTLK